MPLHPDDLMPSPARIRDAPVPPELLAQTRADVEARTASGLASTGTPGVPRSRWPAS